MVRLGWLLVAGAGIWLGVHGSASAAQVRRVGFSDLQSRRVGGQTEVIQKGAWGNLPVLVTVGLDGRVIDARVGGYNSFKVDPEPGLAAARTWRFRPQRFQGRPVIAVGTIYIGYSAPEEPPDASVPFPEGAAEDTEIILERGPCLGPCPGYKLTVKGNGTVLFDAENGSGGTANEAHRAFNADNVLLPGAHVAHVEPAAVAGLIQKFREAQFFGLKAEYTASMTDLPTYTLTVRRAGASKKVVDYAGRAIGMPAAVRALEDAIDAVAGSNRWVHGNLETIAFLEAKGFNFRSQVAADLVAAATEPFHYQYRVRSSEPMIMVLLDKGAPLDATVEQVAIRGPGGEAMVRDPAASLGAVLAYRAAVAGDEPLFRRIEASGYLARLPQDEISRMLMSGTGCSPVIARALIRAGANPTIAGLFGNALARAVDPWTCKGEKQRLEMVRTLIDLGVPVDGGGSGSTPLMVASSPDLARLLLARGANPNAKSEDGTTPLLSVNDDRVALILLRAGADPRSKNARGSVRDHAVERHMPATLAWLDAHGIK